MPSEILTASVLVIGDEILSGRTRDVNVTAIARFLAPLGIDLTEVRFVRDIEDDIVAAVNALRASSTYLFTTGGIGPTHDDITADAIGRAFGVPVLPDPEATALLGQRYKKAGEFNARRQRMARVPRGASLIENPVSIAPGFQIENVFVMAGVPKIMEAMLDDIAPRLKRAPPVLSRSLTLAIAEGLIAEELAAIQSRHKAVSIGSYPFFAGSDGIAKGSAGTTLVVRGRDGAAVDAALCALEAFARALNIEPRSSPATI